jgi:hypothetical protein
VATVTPRTWYLAAAAVLAMVVTAAVDLTVVATRPAKHEAGAPATSPTTTPSTSASTPSPTPTPTSTPTATPTPKPVPVPTLPPNTVAIPALYVIAPIDVCQIVNGGLEPPYDVHRTCYWAGGAPITAGQGTTVLTGHINYVGQGTGAFGYLARMRPGDTVFTSGRKAVVTRWTVVSVRHRPKTAGIETQPFRGPTGPRRLYLISCGGAFDSAKLSYVDNIYVLATPVTATAP